MTLKSGSPKAGRGAKIDAERRNIVKLIAAGGIGVITFPWVFQTARSAGRPVKIGMISPQTGAIASFAEADRFVLAGAQKALEKGVTIAGETHPIQIIYKDSQSNGNRASELAAQLINNDRVDLMLASASSETCNPVSDQCEVKGCAVHHHDRGLAVVVLPAQRRPEEGFRVDLPLQLGVRHGREPVRGHVAVAADEPERRHDVHK
jgi:hypothetical protein